MNENKKAFQYCNSYTQDRVFENRTTASGFTTKNNSNKGARIDRKERKGQSQTDKNKKVEINKALGIILSFASLEQILDTFVDGDEKEGLSNI